MKKTITLSVLIMGLTLAGCASSNVEEDGGNPQSTVLTATAKTPGADATTRVAYTTTGTATAVWETGDVIRMTGNGGYGDLTLTGGAGTSSGTFSGHISLPEAGASYVPCVISTGSANYVSTDAAGVTTIMIAAGTQEGTMADALRHDVLMGTAVSLKSGDTQVGVTGLKHVLSVVRVKITSPKVLTAVGIQSDGGLYQTVTIAADGTVTPGETDKLTTNVTAAPTVSGNVYTVYIPIYPKTTQNLKVVATAADNSAYSFTIASKDVDYTAGQVYGKTMSYLINANNTISEWTESASAGDATVNDHDYVILDTADGIKWATTNIGASLPADYGDYFAWGATSAYTYISDESTTGSNKPWSESNPSGYYNGSEATLPANHDIATILWGGKWKMPTKAQLETLMNYGSKTWTTQKNSKGEDVYG